MKLEHVTIKNFQGINEVTVDFNHTTVLIGENQWGKKSLYNALSLLLSSEKIPYSFKETDFYFYENQHQAKFIQVIFTFAKTVETVSVFDDYPIWFHDEDKKQLLNYVIEGARESNKIITKRSFLDQDLRAISLLPIELVSEITAQLATYYPVLHLYDHKNSYCLPENSNITSEDNGLMANQQLVKMFELLADVPDKEGSKEFIAYYTNSITRILERYFTASHQGECSNTVSEHWEIIEKFNRLFKNRQDTDMQIALSRLIMIILCKHKNIMIEKSAMPILLFDDIGGRFHSIMLSTIWHLFSQLPSQRIIATNSSEMVSLEPLEHICRLVRTQKQIHAYTMQYFNTIDVRKLEFHIRFNHASALFARAWILVEGETEIWLLRELTRQFGYQMESEGLKVITFAQCGLKPLMHFANNMGIEWHVLTDGDDAGQKYARTVINYTEKNKESTEKRLTLLPNQNIELYLYKNGFSDVYNRVARVAEGRTLSPRQTINLAINKTSKPDLAIEITEEIKRRGFSSIPPLLQHMFLIITKNINKIYSYENHL